MVDAEAVSEMDLGKKKCVPCETGKLQALSTEVAHSMLSKVHISSKFGVVWYGKCNSFDSGYRHVYDYFLLIHDQYFLWFLMAFW